MIRPAHAAFSRQNSLSRSFRRTHRRWAMQPVVILDRCVQREVYFINREDDWAFCVVIFCPSSCVISDNFGCMARFSRMFVRVNLVASLFLVGRAHWFAWIRQKTNKKKWPLAQRYRAFSPFSGARTRPMQHVRLLRMLHSTGCVSVDLDLLHCSTLTAKLRCDCTERRPTLVK